MESIKKKLLIYRGIPNGDLEFRDMYHVKEIFDSYLCNKNSGKRVPDWNTGEIKLLKFMYEVFFYRYYGVRKYRLLLASAFF